MKIRLLKNIFLPIFVLAALLLGGGLLVGARAATPPPVVYWEWRGDGIDHRNQQLHKTIKYFKTVLAWSKEMPADWQAEMAELQPQGLAKLQDDIDAMTLELNSSQAFLPPAPTPLTPGLQVRVNYAELNQRLNDLAVDGKFKVCFASFDPPYIAYFLRHALSKLDPGSEKYKTKEKLVKKYEKGLERKVKKKLGPTCCTFEQTPQFVFHDERLQVVIPGKTSCTNLGFQVIRYNVSLPSLTIDIFPENPPGETSYLRFATHTSSGFSVKASIMETILNGKEVKSAVASLFPYFQATQMTSRPDFWEIEMAPQDKFKIESVLEFFALRRIINDCFGVTPSPP